MKHKKAVLYVFVVFFLIISTLIFTVIIKNNSDGNNINVLLGNKINIEDSKTNDTFTNEFMDSNYLKQLILNDASKQIDNKIVKLSYLIKKSKNIYIYIGINDFNTLINEDSLNNKLTYDFDLLKRKQEIYFNNLVIIKNKIIQINDKANITFIKLPYLYLIKDKTILDFYSNINEKLDEI